jgi:mRNA interferase MazF
MPIQFHPGVSAVVLCDFSTGFIQPEMVKKRPAVIITPQMGSRPNLCTVVPISTDPPRRQENYHHELTALQLPAPFDKGPNWVKADLVFSASFQRLSLFQTARGHDGKRNYMRIFVQPQDFRCIQRAVLCGLGLSSLTKHHQDPT